jgi:signal transduction histidine kinase/ActR/RegA family two-component response regulator
MSGRHRLLARQLRKTLVELPEPGTPLADLLDLVDATYRQADDERALLEHSMDTVSAELDDRYRRLREALDSSRTHERALAETASLLRSAVDSTEDGLLVVDLEGRIALYNRRFVEIWRIPESILERADDDAALEFVLDQLAEPESFLAKVRALYADRDAESFDLLRFEDGRVLERYSRPHRMGGATVGRVWSFRDVSKRTRLEAQLRQAQKMEAIGLLAGGVAHDFNNLLTVIFGYAELLERQLEGSPVGAREVRRILDAAERAARLTRQLLAFSRQQILQPELLDLNAVLADLKPMLARLIRENVEIRLELASEIGPIRVDRGQLEQMLVNLAVNARDAMPNGGTLTFATDQIDDAIDATWADDAGGAWIALDVADTGSGIAPEHLSRIFEPFFTTKPTGQGTGLGLAMVYGFLQQSGGRIAVESQVGRGTRFHAYFPCAERGESAAREAVAEAAAGRETLLLVEDEEPLREVVRRALEGRGYRVLAAGGADEALRLARAADRSIDLLVTDVVMPGLGGAELARELERLQPGIRVLFTSGYTDDEVVRQGVRAAAVRFLAKPFTQAELAWSVRAVLDARLPG